MCRLGRYSMTSLAHQVTQQLSFADLEASMYKRRQGFALVPCEHARFCESCALRVAELDAGCPVCRAQITMMMRLFQ